MGAVKGIRAKVGPNLESKGLMAMQDMNATKGAFVSGRPDIHGMKRKPSPNPNPALQWMKTKLKTTVFPGFYCLQPLPFILTLTLTLNPKQN